MSKTRIEWCTHSVNPVKGLCPVDCRDLQGKPYCYARKMYLNPYYKSMHENLEIRFEGRQMWSFPDKPSRIFVGSTMELFGPWVKPSWLKDILGVAANIPRHTFIFLTKRPQELARWSPFPPNVHIGVSVTNQAMHPAAIVGLAAIEAKVKFISFEPLLGPVSLHSPYDLVGIQWVIIGQRTPVSARTSPKVEWLRDIVESADQAGVPCFLKDNLYSLLATDSGLPKWAIGDSWSDTIGRLRQEFPKACIRLQEVTR